MDKCSTDAEFDSYWDNEAKNQNRNRIRVGRQYQATIPPLLKPGEKDGRKCEDLETLKWKPDQLSDQKLEEYMSMAKGISLFSKSVSSSRTPEKSDNSLQSAIKGLTEFVASHHPCHHDDGCRQVPNTSPSGESSKINVNQSWSPSEAQLFAQALEACGKNFSAIKKEFLPWKPVRSIIEYYYQTKSDKDDKKESFDKIVPKKEDPIPSCSHEEKPCVKEEPILADELPNQTTNAEDPPKDKINFLDHSRVTETCSAAPETSFTQDDKVSPSSTVGSLKFFLGGRLVLKLNAQQDGGSGNKCQWVQSNDLPKHSNYNKKDKHKKKYVPYGYFSSTPGAQKPTKKGDDSSLLPNNLPDSDTSNKKKSEIKSEYDLSDSGAQGLLLCSSSWTPPVADGQESIEVDDCSSKTSEGYISPVLSCNSRTSKTDTTKQDSACVPELGEQKCDSDPMWAKTENCIINDSASKNTSILGGKNSPNQSCSSPLKKEVLNHKSALSHGRPCVKSPCYQRSSHSNSPLLKQRNKWSNISYPLKSSSSSLSPVYLDLRNSLKESALDLSSKTDNGCDDADHVKQTQNISETVECTENILCESDSRPDSSEFSPQSSNLGLHTQSVESPRKESCTACNCCEGVSTDQLPFDNSLRKDDNDFLANKESDDNSQLSYTYCNLPYHCALPKCTKDYTLEEHLCNKSSDRKDQVDCPEYLINDDESICERNPHWCSKSMSSYFPYYSHCYPYYVTYGMAPQNSAESTDTELTETPLDLSSTNETKTEKLPNSEKISENSSDGTSQNTEAGGRGMLYQLLKNKTK